MGECGGKTPGPAYGLGTLTGHTGHDFTKSRAPAYSLGLRPAPISTLKTPGPYKIGSVDRNGRYPYQGWTMESNTKPKGKNCAATEARPSSVWLSRFRPVHRSRSAGVRPGEDASLHARIQPRLEGSEHGEAVRSELSGLLPAAVGVRTRIHDVRATFLR